MQLLCGNSRRRRKRVALADGITPKNNRKRFKMVMAKLAWRGHSSQPRWLQVTSSRRLPMVLTQQQVVQHHQQPEQQPPAVVVQQWKRKMARALLLSRHQWQQQRALRTTWMAAVRILSRSPLRNRKSSLLRPEPHRRLGWKLPLSNASQLLQTPFLKIGIMVRCPFVLGKMFSSVRTQSMAGSMLSNGGQSPMRVGFLLVQSISMVEMKKVWPKQPPLRQRRSGGPVIISSHSSKGSGGVAVATKLVTRVPPAWGTRARRVVVDSSSSGSSSNRSNSHINPSQKAKLAALSRSSRPVATRISRGTNMVIGGVDKGI
mmetsp:Transcript_59887/g.118758  ORF Transcript_59887/g.118758 Transcript_59887/m.118758 type:complete len:317 (-) Transcript_59887:477-1427(-)